MTDLGLLDLVAELRVLQDCYGLEEVSATARPSGRLTRVIVRSGGRVTLETDVGGKTISMAVDEEYGK